MCPQNYTSPEVLDYEDRYKRDHEDIKDDSVILGKRCNPNMIHNQQPGRRGSVMEDAVQ